MESLPAPRSSRPHTTLCAATTAGCAAVLFLASAAASVPSTLLLDPRLPIQSFLLTVAVVIIGVAILLAPWDRLDDAWIRVW